MLILNPPQILSFNYDTNFKQIVNSWLIFWVTIYHVQKKAYEHWIGDMGGNNPKIINMRFKDKNGHVVLKRPTIENYSCLFPLNRIIQ